MNRIVTWLLGSDPAELLGEGDWQFGFVAEYGNYVNLAVIAVFVAMVYLIVRSYRREGTNPAGAKAFLAAVRIAVCLLVLAVLFRPAVVLRFTRTLYSTVLVLIDDSRSMSFTDRYADPNLRAKVAAHLGVPPGELDGWSRLRIVQKSLGGDSGVLARLAKDHPLMLMRFSTDRPGQEAYTRPLGRLAGSPEAGPSGSNPTAGPTTAPAGLDEVLGRLTAGGYETDLSAAIRDAIESVVGRRVAGIVLLSDGQMTTSGARGRLADAIAYANQQGLRLYPVMVGDPSPPKNVAVTGLQAPREVRRAASTEFTVVLAHRNLSGRSVTVKLLRRPRDSREWSDTGLRKTVVLDGEKAAPLVAAGRTKGVQTVALHVEPDKIGPFVYRALVEPVPEEKNRQDNAADAEVKVSDEKIKVLLISGDGGWELQFVRNFLLRQPELYRLSVWQQNADKELNQSASTGMKLDRLPATLAELVGSPGGKPHPGYDVVILYDPQPTVDGFDGNFVGNLRVFVERHGGGLCYIVGNKYSAPVLRSRGPYEDLADMLPVVLAANTSDIVERIGRRRPQAWPVRVTSYGADHPVTRFAATAEESVNVWQALPGLYWSHPILKTKPLARTLAVNSNPLRRIPGKNEPEPLLVAQPFGMGRVLYLGFDGTWRWRFLRDGYYHRLFWSNVVRYLATLRARHVVITAGGDRFSAGERITVEAEAYDENFSPLRAETLDVEMIDVQTQKSETIVLKAVAKKPGRYKATIRAARTGTFELTALKGDPMAKEKVQSKIIRIELPKAESLRTEADRATLENIASRRENFLEIHEINRLAELIPSDRKTAVWKDPWELWDSNLTLLVIVLLLAVEWIFRKKYNMA